MSKEQIYEAEKKAFDILNDNNLATDVYEYGDDMPAIHVEIRLGDWKHEHWRTRWLLEQNGFIYVSEDVIEENGSDCYSAIHTYLIR